MQTQLEALRDLLTDAVADADCEVGRIAITAGRPAAPSGEGEECQTAIFVFGNNIADLNQGLPDACVVKSRWAMEYEIWVCYPEGWDDVSDDEHASAAECLHELMDLVWCALVDAYDSGVPFGGCEDIELQPLQVQPRGGGAVSALGGLVVPYQCAVDPG